MSLRGWRSPTKVEEMNSRLQIIAAAATGAIIVAVAVLAAGWLENSHGATVTCSFYHEGPEDADTCFCKFIMQSSLGEELDSEVGYVDPGDSVVITLAHGWRNDVSSNVKIGVRVYASGYLTGGDVDHMFYDLFDSAMVSDSHYAMGCRIHTYQGEDATRDWDVYCVHPNMLDLFDPVQVGTVELSLYNDGDSFTDYYVQVGQCTEVSGRLEALSSLNLTIPVYVVLESDPLGPYDCHVVVHSTYEIAYEGISSVDPGGNVTLSVTI